MITDKIILGIDPGTTIMGYGIIKQTGNKISFITMDVLKLDKFSNQPIKLKKIFETCLDLIEKYHPDALALEAPFYGKNVQSMLKLGRAQGVAMAAGLYRSIPIFEYSPKKIKQSVTGNGNASKEQVAAMLLKLLNLKEIPLHLDATDGLAAAVCHFFQRDIGGDGDSSFTGWKSYVSKNPEKVIKKPL